MKATPRQKHSIYLKKQNKNKQTPTTDIFKTQGKKQISTKEYQSDKKVDFSTERDQKLQS